MTERLSPPEVPAWASAEELRQTQAAHGQAADLEEGATRQAIAVAESRTGQGEHGLLLEQVGWPHRPQCGRLASEATG